MKQLTKEQAIVFSESYIWEDWNYRQRAEFQMLQEKLCMPFSIFYEAIKKTLNRPVYTHEFGFNYDGLMGELFLGHEPPTFDEIVELIPKDKRIIILKD